MSAGQSTTVTTRGGTSTLGLLGVVFVVLKLTGVIDWSWWWVTAPFWGGMALMFAVGAVILIIAGIAVGVESIQDHRASKRRRALRELTRQSQRNSRGGYR